MIKNRLCRLRRPGCAGNILGVAVVLISWGCVPRAAAQSALEFTSDDSFYVASAFNATAIQFLGPPPAPKMAMRLPPQPLVDLGGVSFDRVDAYSRIAARQTGLVRHFSFAVSNRVDMVGHVGVSWGGSRYYLPTGAGPFIDPITVNFTNRSLRGEVGIAYLLAQYANLQFRASTAIGGQVARVETSVRSALLDVHNTSIIRHGYLFVGAEILPVMHKRGARFNAGIRIYPGTAAILIAGLSFPL